MDTRPPDPPDEPEIDPEELRAKVYADPEWFLRECLGLNPWEKEVEIIKSVRDHMKTLVAGCVSSGKTHATAGLVFWWMAAFFPARVFCLAPTERQLKINLWGEIPRIFSSAPYPLGGNMMPLSLQYRLGDDWFAMGFSPQDKMGVFGIHGPHDLLIIDDAQGVKNEIWDALENAMAGGTTKLLASCNPVVTSGEIYDAMTSKRGKYNVIRIPADITPNVKEGRIVIPGMITREMADQWIADYGIDSDFVRSKVFALLPKQEPDTLIPLDWLEAATMREIKQKGNRVLGVDVARFGDDDTVICPVDGRQCLPLIVIHGNDTMQVAGRVAIAYREMNADECYVDEIGIGAGVVDRLNEQQFNVHGVNVSEKASDPERFANLRSEMWWAARESLDPRNGAAMAIPNDPRLIADLASIKWRPDSSGRIVIEPKEKTKERIGHSPDIGDAYCLAVYKAYTASAKPFMVAGFNGITVTNPFEQNPNGFRRQHADWM